MLFQSTRPRGTRPAGCRDGVADIAVSIHASARDATRLSKTARLTLWFQSTRPRGTRQFDVMLRIWPVVSIHASARDATRSGRCSASTKKFQSTRPRGTRRGAGRRGGRQARFNPRVREGRDRQGLRRLPFLRLFQSTRPRGTRPGGIKDAHGGRCVSIHASARDATL